NSATSNTTTSNAPTGAGQSVVTDGAIAGGAVNSSDAAGSLAGAPLAATSVPAGGNAVGGNLVGLRVQVLPGALINRPDIVGAQATLEARQAQVQALRRERLPAVELQARRSSFFGREGAYGLRAVVTMPLFDFGSIKREQRAAEADVRAQESTILLLRSQVATQIEQALLRLQQLQQTVERYRSGIVPLTLDLLRKTQIGYAQGASTYLEVLEAQRTLRQVQTEYLQALVGIRTQEAALEGALGAAPSAELLGTISNPTAPATLPGTSAPGTVPQGTVAPLQQEPYPSTATKSTTEPAATEAR
ncbi:MAG: outer membrane protein heavy metal efflux system, partial [Abditibacteriota bacterium]|nr:outer membrane protein heavy metal efflux system [Abditibacteriota bacterium]